MSSPKYRISPQLVDRHTSGCVDCADRRSKIEMLHKIELGPSHLDEIRGRDLLLDQVYNDCCECILNGGQTMRVSIKRCNLNDVLSRPNFYNVNNLGPRPDNYEEELARTRTKNWVNLFHKEVPKIIIDGEDLQWIKKAALTIGVHTRKFSHIYDDEIEATCKKYEPIFSNIPFREEGWFIRTERVSLKEGMHGTGPYGHQFGGLRRILESICSSGIGHEAVRNADAQLTIYFLPWQPSMSSSSEFRIFVYQNDITAISDQHLYTVNEWLNSKGEDEIREIVHFIVKYFKENIRDKLASTMANRTYTMDFALLNGKIPYFIECNSFGAPYAAGSALFNWIEDDAVLRSNGASVELRYVHSEEE